MSEKSDRSADPKMRVALTPDAARPPRDGHADDAPAGPVVVDLDAVAADAGDDDDAGDLAAEGSGAPADPSFGTPEDLETLLGYLKVARGFDFTGYKRASLSRRIAKRLETIGVADYRAYLDYLEVHPGEFDALFNTVLINVTAFFRDPDAWEYVATELVPRILAQKRPGEPVRAWSACCASGEEAYTIAIVLAEALGLDQFRERVKIYATDLDEHALARARAGSYSLRDVDGIPPALLERYFTESEGEYTFRADLRRCVIFGRHDLLQDAPISRVDLLACRNALMYFNSESQARILSRFHFALPERGYLFLGRAETLLTHSSMFAPVDLKRRVFTKVPRTNLRDRLGATSTASGAERDADGPLSDDDALLRAREAAFDAGAAAQVVVDAAGRLALANERARLTFGLVARDLGRPLQDLELSYRPIELRSCIERAYAEGRPVHCGRVTWRLTSGDARTLDVTVTSLVDGSVSPLGVSVVFADVTAVTHLQAELERANQELESAYEELQSTNEELETTNEELQSTNEELQTINDEVRVTSDQRNDVNALLEAILTSLRGGVVVVDRDMKVLLWNAQSEDMWGLRADEVEGRHLIGLDIGLPMATLEPEIRSCLAGLVPVAETKLHATNRRGRRVECAVRCSALRGQGEQIRGAILIVEQRGAEAP